MPIYLYTIVYIFFISFIDPCAKKACDSYRVCVVQSDRTAQCLCGVCPDDEIYKPVCANDGHSYATQCRMIHESCKKGSNIRLVKEGSCGMLNYAINIE